ncbi:MAG: signal peptidase II [Pseudomonadota bacterium]|jgi:signal peptidase II|nr:signal peptidase II [Syntrophaceae bacterium]MBP7033806.1 signal peptidase II [Syntrophobacterales bacterium]MDI9554408.1 signal peptidase II [Pseudomonadota bacterium]NLX30157.1 signal peptidase II [Deltaproteobacteria bacterium]HNU84766.1 signal peptidase II [Syntrophales bacterium]
MKRHHLLFVMTVLVIVVLDQISKVYIDTHMTLHDSIPVVQGFFNITYVRNPGAAFGFLADSTPLVRAFFLIGVSIFASGLIVYYVMKMKTEDILLTYGMSLIMGGAVGNLIDRVRLGEVIDFLDVYISTYHWPAFNVADSAVSIGAVILFYKLIRGQV